MTLVGSGGAANTLQTSGEFLRQCRRNFVMRNRICKIIEDPKMVCRFFSACSFIFQHNFLILILYSPKPDFLG